MKPVYLFPLLLLPLLTEAVDHHAGGTGVSSEILARSGSSWDGAKLPAYPAEAPEITVLKVTIPPGAKLGWHKHASINVGYLLSGQLTVFAEAGREMVLNAGDPLIELVGSWHYGRNTGTTPAQIVVVYFGAEGRPLSVMKEEDA